MRFPSFLGPVSCLIKRNILFTNSKSGLPYFKFLREKGKEHDREVRKSDFAVMQREALENYLIGLIRAVVSSAF